MRRWVLWSVCSVFGCGSAAEPATDGASASSSVTGPGVTASSSDSSRDTTSTSTSTSTDVTKGSASDSDASTSSETSSRATADASSTGRELERCGLGVFPRAWADGTECGEAPGVQVHRYSENTFILRQSLCTGFEGPFLYLLFGEDRVLLEDTGYNGVDVASVVRDVIDSWLAERGRDSIELVVVNSHAHGDHVGGNDQFIGLPNITVVGIGVAAVSSFFGIDDWPQDTAQYDLGGRTIDVVPIPGHESAHLALFDPTEGLLLTGDTLYPGRLYISNFGQYVQSIDRLVQHVGEREVCHVLGTHIEMTDVAGVDFEFGASQHPSERVLELAWEHLLELRDSVSAMDTPMLEVHDDFIIYPL